MPVCSNCGGSDFVWAENLRTGTIGRGMLSLRSGGELALGTRVCRGCGHADLFVKDPTLLREPHRWRPGEFVPIPSKPAGAPPAPHPPAAAPSVPPAVPAAPLAPPPPPGAPSVPAATPAAPPTGGAAVSEAPPEAPAAPTKKPARRRSGKGKAPSTTILQE